MAFGRLDTTRTWEALKSIGSFFLPKNALMNVLGYYNLDQLGALLDKMEAGKDLAPEEEKALMTFMKKTGVEPLPEDVVEGNE